VLAGGLAGSVAIGVAGCGAVVGAAKAVEAKAPTNAQITAAMKSATSVHVSGLVGSGTQASQMNLAIARSGALSGTVVAPGTPAITMISAGSTAWIKIDAPFLKSVGAPASTCATACGKYMIMTGQSATQMTSGLTLDTFTKAVADELPALTFASKTTLNGQSVFKYTGPDHAVLYVAAHGQPYPLLLAGGPGESGTLALSQWNSAAVTPPPARDVIKASQL
jgi:hypothetical protein